MLTEDMARNPMAVVQSVARPAVPGIAHPTVDGMTPADPGYQKKIPPPEPMSKVEAALIEEEKRRQEAIASGSPLGAVVSGQQQTSSAASPSAFRLLVTCSRLPNMLVVGIESPPDWDVTRSWTMTQDAALHVALVCRALGVKIKDMSGGELGVPNERVPVREESPIQDPNPGGPRLNARDLSYVRWTGADHAREPVGRTDPSGETGVRALDPESTVEYLEAARRQYEAELARNGSSEGEPEGGEATGSAPDDRENALRRRLGLPESPAGAGEVRVEPRDHHGTPGNPDPVAPGEAGPQSE